MDENIAHFSLIGFLEINGSHFFYVFCYFFHFFKLLFSQKHYGIRCCKVLFMVRCFRVWIWHWSESNIFGTKMFKKFIQSHTQNRPKSATQKRHFFQGKEGGNMNLNLCNIFWIKPSLPINSNPRRLKMTSELEIPSLCYPFSPNSVRGGWKIGILVCTIFGGLKDCFLRQFNTSQQR